jgi:hypothetical protein
MMNWTDDDCRMFSTNVDKLRGLWAFIVKKFHENHDDKFWIEMVKTSEHFKRLSESNEEIPEELPSVVADARLPRREREPHVLAMLHACKELNISDCNLQELKAMYARGKHLLVRYG